MKYWLVLLLLIALPVAAEPRHGLSAFGDLKYPKGFASFDYVNAAAPKGGELRQHSFGTFDNFNPGILRGNVAPDTELLYATLLTRALDEPDAMYGYVANSVELDPDRMWVAFNIDPRARWSDGKPVTAADVVFTFESLIKDGHPIYRLSLHDVDGAKAESDRRVVFHFKPTEGRRDLPLVLAALPLMQKAWFEGREFGRPTLDPPPGAGPYTVEKAEMGRFVTYQRNADWWARDLPTMKGRYNPDRMSWIFFRDRDVAVEGFFAGEYDLRNELTSRVWATGYEGKPAVEKGWIKRETLADGQPASFQAIYFNTRRAKFADPRVREALNLAFDFEWTNKNLFYGIYKRLRSRFDNSPLAATGKPSPEELKLLEPFRNELPPALFEREFEPPKTDGSGENRENLRRARQLLADAGWVIKDGRLVNASTGEKFEIEFLEYEPSTDRYMGPYARHLDRLGISARTRLVDVAGYENRVRDFDFDMMSRAYGNTTTPGVELRNFFSTKAAGTSGSFNFPGIKSAAADALIEKVVQAKSREELNTAARALDRVLMWNWYWIPAWYSGQHRLAYWDKVGRPNPIAPLSSFNPDWADDWWVDEAKAAKLPRRN